MKRKILLFLSAYSFHARLWHNGKISEAYKFSDDSEGQAKFAAFLQINKQPALLLTDLIEEDFRNETLPHLRGSQRRAQQQRKFEQFYRNTHFRQAILHRRQEEGRRDDEMLFSALTNPHLITPWLEIIHQQQIPLIGVYSVPTISSPLLKSIPSEHILLLSWEKTAGLRQTYFNEKCLFLSRLSPVSSGDSFNSIIVSETARTLQYLKSLSMLPPGEQLHVCIICHANDQPALEQIQQNSDDIAYHYLDIQGLSQELKVTGEFTDSDATPLLLGLLASKPPANQYAPKEDTHLFSLQKLNLRLLQLSLLGGIGCLLWGATDLWQSSVLNDDGKELVQQAQQLEHRTQEIIKGFPHQLASPADMKSAVTTVSTLNNNSPAPQDVWSKLSSTLNNYARIRINNLVWQTAPSSSSTGTTSGLSGSGMKVSGEVEGLNGDYRSALLYLEQFQEALQQDGYNVEPISMPLDISSKGSISETSDPQQQKPALFSLKLTWGTAQ